MQIESTLKIIGPALTTLGSLLLAYRVKIILHDVIHTLVAHETGIQGLAQIAENTPQTSPVVTGYVKHLLDTRDKPGVKLLIAGFVLIAIGAACQGVSAAIGFWK